MRYKTQGTCSSAIDIELKDGVIESVQFTGGCNGIRCGFKSTSCPDQLARALETMV